MTKQLKLDLHLPEYFYLLQGKPFKYDEMCVLFHLQSSYRSQDVKLFKHRLDYKDNVNFKIYDSATWETNNYNTNIAQYHTR